MALALAILLLPASRCYIRTASRVAEQGILDLRDWRPADGTVQLVGEWRYYPRQLLESGDAPVAGAPPAYASVPGTWDRHAGSGDEPDGHGFATFGLTVLLPPTTPPLGLRLITVSSAYRLLVDGDVVASAGTVATTAAEGEPMYRPRVVPLSQDVGGEVELLLQASNYSYARGGVWEPIWIGAFETLMSARETRIALALFLAGSFSAIGLYHLMLWGPRPDDRSPLLFALICFAMAVRGLTVDEVFLVDLLPDLGWASQVRLEYASLLMIVAAIPPFMRELFPQEYPRPVVHFYTASALAGLVFVCILSPDRFSRGLPLIQLLCVSAAVVGTILVARAVVRGRTGARLFLVSLLAITVTGIHDVLVSMFRSLPTSHWLVNSIYLQPFGLFVFILSQAMLLALRSSGAFSELEATSRALSSAHGALDAHARELEQRVTQRTAELEAANRELEGLAETDGLTGLRNRRFFEDELRRTWLDHQRRGAPLSLIFLDIDHFKRYNDCYGHIAGDEALRKVAAVVAGCTQRPGDAVARYGGEELVALLPNTDLEGAGQLAGRLRERVETAAIAHSASGVEPHVTISAGVATLVPKPEIKYSELVDRADRALYRAKQEGRNRVVVA